MRKEGYSWRNMLGCIMGIVFCAATVIPIIIGEVFQRTTIVDVHNEKGIALYIETFIENSIFSVVAYLECILLGTIIIGVKSARKIPSFDKDYILILGCQIKKDGTLTKLLQSRTDRAIEFAKMQKEANGKEIIFVPSGGKGSDEVVAEAEAISNYLVETGISEDRILVENKSTSTYENLKNSLEIIREHSDTAEPKLAFSTTNYHVFRAGLLASQQGIKAEGIGSKTKRYFWLNAFIREFIATLYSERKSHRKIILTLVLVTILMVLTVYLSNNL